MSGIVFSFTQSMAKSKVTRERARLLHYIEDLVETPMVILGFIWLGLLIYELVYELNPLLEKAGLVIWALFILDFLLKFWLAPEKLHFLKSNILTIISLVVPAIRVFRIFRVLRVLRFSRSLRLVKVLGSLNRGMRALSNTMKRRAFGYVISLTAIILFTGAAGMYAFEREDGLTDYTTALWWTAMLLTTMGSEYWPQTTEGRILCFFLALYAFAVFGYVTATIATFFIGKDAEEKTGSDSSVEELRKEIMELKTFLRDSQKR